MIQILQPQDFQRSWVSPPTTKQVHAPTVLATTEGLIAAWFQGAHEGAKDNRIYLARCNGETWSSPEVLHAQPIAHWNPVLTRVPQGDLWMFFKRGQTISSWRTWYSVSSDEGRTWSEAAPLNPQDPTGGRGPVKNPPIYAGNSWIAPASSESWGEPPIWEAFVDISDDGGRTWQKSPIPLDRSQLRGAGVIQPALWHGRDPHVVHALMRSTEGWAYQATSHDRGRTWSPGWPSTLPNNNSGLTVAQISPGVVAAIYNPVTGDWAPRCPLALALSSDDGATWTQVGIVDDGATPIDGDPTFQPVRPQPADAPRGKDTGVLTTGRGEYSYPSAIVDGGVLTICYTWQRRRIVCARITVESIPHTRLEDKKAR